MQPVQSAQQQGDVVIHVRVLHRRRCGCKCAAALITDCNLELGMDWSALRGHIPLVGDAVLVTERLMLRSRRRTPKLLETVLETWFLKETTESM